MATENTIEFPIGTRVNSLDREIVNLPEGIIVSDEKVKDPWPLDEDEVHVLWDNCSEPEIYLKSWLLVRQEQH